MFCGIQRIHLTLKWLRFFEMSFYLIWNIAGSSINWVDRLGETSGACPEREFHELARVE